MNYAFLKTLLGVTLLSIPNLQAPISSAPTQRPVKTNPQAIARYKYQSRDKEAEGKQRVRPGNKYKFEHPVYRGEKLGLIHPVWDGTPPKIIFVDGKNKQSEISKNVLGTIEVQTTPASSAILEGGVKNGAEKKN